MSNFYLWRMIYCQGRVGNQMLLFNSLLFEVITQSPSGTLCLRLWFHLQVKESSDITALSESKPCVTAVRTYTFFKHTRQQLGVGIKHNPW